jgi:hypothetical protein
MKRQKCHATDGTDGRSPARSCMHAASKVVDGVGSFVRLFG